MKNLKVLLFFVGLALVHVFPVYAGDCTIFGPKTFERGKGKPVTDKVSFTSRETGSGFTLLVRNGDRDRDLEKDRHKDRNRFRGWERDDRHSVSSAVITLNGVEIIGPYDFNRRTETIERKVTLKTKNILAVTLDGKPESFLTVAITGKGSGPTRSSLWGHHFMGSNLCC